MSSAMLQKNETGKDFAIPSYKYSPTRWATTRENNTETMVGIWDQNPNTVMLLNDPKFKDKNLVIMRQEIFENIIKLLRDISSGEIQIKSDTKILLEAIALIVARISEQKLEQQDQILKHSMQLISSIQSQITTSYSYAYPPGQVEPSKLTKEEIELAESFPED